MSEMDEANRRDMSDERKYREAAQALDAVLRLGRLLNPITVAVLRDARDRCEARADHIVAVWN